MEKEVSWSVRDSRVLLKDPLLPLLREAFGRSTSLRSVTGGHDMGNQAPLPYEHVDQDLSRQAHVSRASDRASVPPVDLRRRRHEWCAADLSTR